MESILNIILSTENVRTLVTIVSIFTCFVWLKTSLEKKIDRLDRKMESSINELKYNDFAHLSNDFAHLEASLNKRIDDLKYNDFAHLTNAFKALTYVLEKNGSLSKEDKEYVDSQLALECSPS